MLLRFAFQVTFSVARCQLAVAAAGSQSLSIAAYFLTTDPECYGSGEKNQHHKQQCRETGKTKRA